MRWDGMGGVRGDERGGDERTCDGKGGERLTSVRVIVSDHIDDTALGLLSTRADLRWLDCAEPAASHHRRAGHANVGSLGGDHLRDEMRLGGD
jgi:hypothetical protein